VNLCSKPGCGNPGAAILGYDYAARRAVLDDPPAEVSPHSYVLCTRCAGKLTPPRGWELEDLRAEPPLFLDRVKDRVEAPAAEAKTLPPLGEPERRQLFFGYTA
jgi:hypothetical protein